MVDTKKGGRVSTRDVVIAIASAASGIAAALGTVAGANPVTPGDVQSEIAKLKEADTRQEGKIDKLLVLACRTHPDDSICAEVRR